MIEGFYIYEGRAPLLLFPTNGADVADMRAKIAACPEPGPAEGRRWTAPLAVAPRLSVLARQIDRLRLYVPFGPDAAPLAVESLADRIVDVLETYFRAPLTPSLVVANKVRMVLVLGAMVDTGVPRISHSNILEHLLARDGLIAQLLGSAGVSTQPAATPALPVPGTAAVVPDALAAWDLPWRRPDVTHFREEVFVDVVERVRATQPAVSPTRHGGATQMHVRGEVRLTSYLSLTPRVKIDVRLPVAPSRLQLHPGVDLGVLQPGMSTSSARTPPNTASYTSGAATGSPQRSYLLSLVPPDGRSVVATYALTHVGTAALGVRLERHRDRFELILSTGIDAKTEQLEDVVVEITFPPAVCVVKELSATTGDFDTSDPQRCVFRLGESVPMGWKAHLRAQALDAAGRPVAPLAADASYSLMGRVPSAATVASVKVDAGTTKPVFKGVRYRTEVETYLAV